MDRRGHGKGAGARVSPKLLREAGESLYGPQWQSELARALGVNDRTVRRWLAGGNAIPAWVWKELAPLMPARARLIIEVWGRLPGV